MFKIKYQVNLLPSVSEETGQLMNAVAGSDQMEIFQTDLIKDMVDYKWETFAQRQHIFGAMLHLSYVVVLMLYINEIFLIGERDGPANKTLLAWIGGCLVYPTFYDGT